MLLARVSSHRAQRGFCGPRTGVSVAAVRVYSAESARGKPKSSVPPG